MRIPLPKWIQNIRSRTAARRKAFHTWAAVIHENRSVFSEMLQWNAKTRQDLCELRLKLHALRIALLCRQSAYINHLYGQTTLECFLYLGEVTKHQRKMDKTTDGLDDLINALTTLIPLWHDVEE